MTTNQQMFLYAVEEMNFTRAAERAFVTQQCLSDHIRRLEKNYNVKLFDRTPKLKLTKTIDGYNAGDTEGEFTNATLVFKVTYKVDGEEIVRYMNVQYNADTGAVTTAELDKIPIDADISVDEVYSDNYESEQTSDIELVTDEETGESYYTVSFDNTLKRIEHGSGIINKYEKDASGNFHLQYRIKDGTNPQEPK